MSEVTSFNVKGKSSDYQFSVKSEFLKGCPNPQEVPLKDLLTTHKMINFFHNPSGPAIIKKNRDKVHMEYWIDGQKLSEEEGQKIAHNFAFNNKLMTEIES